MGSDPRSAQPDPLPEGLTRRRALSLLGLAPAAVACYLPTGCEDGQDPGVAGTTDGDRAGVRNVKDEEFGAVGDGRADDTEAIQAAIDSLPAGDVRGGTVLLPVGHYRVTSPLKIHGRSTRVLGLGGSSAIESDPGYGSVLLAATPGMTLLEIGDDLGINQFGPTLENLSLVADHRATGVTLAKNRSTIQSTFKNCYFRRAQTGVQFTSVLSGGGRGDSGWAYFEQCLFYELEHGILSENDEPQEGLSNQFALFGGGFTNCSYPIRIASGSGGARIFGPKINNGKVGVYIGGSACQIFGAHIEGCDLGIMIESDGVIPTSGDANFVCGAVIVGYEGSSGGETGVRIGSTATNTTVMNTDYANLGTDFVDDGANTLHMPLGGPLALSAADGEVLRFAYDAGRSTAALRTQNGLLFDLGGGDAGDGFAIELPSGTPSSKFEVRSGDGQLCSLSGDGVLSLPMGGLHLRSAPPPPRPPEGDGLVLFARENEDGKTELRVRFGSGAEQVVVAEP